MAIPPLPATKGKLRILVLSESGDLAIGIAHHLQNEGHNVEVYLSQAKRQKMSADPGKGFLERQEKLPTNFREWDLVLTCGRGFARVVEQLQRDGIPVVGPNSIGERLELERDFGLSTLKEHGIRVPEWELFRSVPAATKWLAQQKGRFVVKPNGAHAPSHLSYASKFDDNEDLLSVLTTVARENPEAIRDGFILQKFVEGIAEESSGTFFTARGEWVQPVMLNFEFKSLTSGNFPGASTGEMGSVAKYVKNPRLFRETTAKMQPWLKKTGYVGDFDVSNIISDKGPWSLEVTPRFGYCAALMQCYAFEPDFGRFLYGVATGTVTEVKVADDWIAAVGLNCLPFPMESAVKSTESYAGFLVSGPVLHDPRLFPMDLRKQGDNLETCGSGYVLVACGGGKTWEAAVDEAQDALESVHVPFGLSRPDIGQRLDEQGPQLEKIGYL